MIQCASKHNMENMIMITIFNKERVLVVDVETRLIEP